MAKKPSGRRRADVEINVLEQFELRSRRSIIDAANAKATRQLRRAERKAARLAEREMKAAKVQIQTAMVDTGQIVVREIPVTKNERLRPLRQLTTISVALGMFTTTVLPAYAFSPDVAAMARFTTTDATEIMSGADTQGLTVVAVNIDKYTRGAAKSISTATLFRQQLKNRILIDRSPKIAALLANPEFSKLDPVQIMNVASRFEGTPYAFGGDTPAAFDCSGYVAYVFAHFGVPLPHSVHGQSMMGKAIAPEHARPGDIVIFNDLSHDGIYAGNGNFWHAPRPGDRVKLAPIYTSNIHFIRFSKPN